MKKLNTVEEIKVTRLVNTRLASKAMVCAASMMLTTLAQAGPTNGVVNAGSATISQSGNTTTINQTSSAAVIDWAGFDISSNEAVNFNQPNSQSVALNRIAGSASRIDGQLTANGKLFLLNQQGILFGQNASVNVNGLLATTSQISNEDFMAGNYRFTASSAANNFIENRGSIQIADAGMAALVGANVTNSGVIQARLGSVTLATNENYTLDLFGDGLLSFDTGISRQATNLTNTGTLDASGGVVMISAGQASNVVSSVINLDGIVRATSLENQAGRIVLSGGSGAVNVSGTLDASSVNNQGGEIEVLSDQITLTETAQIDSSGASGGGNIWVGGDFQGEGDRQTATNTTVLAGAQINSSAISNGNAGEVIVWADGATRFAGDIRANGGALGGDGALVEVSGRDVLSFIGNVSTRADQGRGGTLLLDPLELTIVDSNDQTLDTDNQISWARINQQGAENENVVIQATNDIFIEAFNEDMSAFSVMANGVSADGNAVQIMNFMDVMEGTRPIGDSDTSGFTEFDFQSSNFPELVHAIVLGNFGDGTSLNIDSSQGSIYFGDSTDVIATNGGSLRLGATNGRIGGCAMTPTDGCSSPIMGGSIFTLGGSFQARSNGDISLNRVITAANNGITISESEFTSEDFDTAEFFEEVTVAGIVDILSDSGNISVTSISAPQSSISIITGSNGIFTTRSVETTSGIGFASGEQNFSNDNRSLGEVFISTSRIESDSPGSDSSISTIFISALDAEIIFTDFDPTAPNTSRDSFVIDQSHRTTLRDGTLGPRLEISTRLEDGTQDNIFRLENFGEDALLNDQEITLVDDSQEDVRLITFGSNSNDGLGGPDLGSTDVDLNSFLDSVGFGSVTLNNGDASLPSTAPQSTLPNSPFDAMPMFPGSEGQQTPPDTSSSDTRRDQQLAANDESETSVDCRAGNLAWITTVVASDADTAGFNRGSSGGIPVSIEEALEESGCI